MKACFPLRLLDMPRGTTVKEIVYVLLLSEICFSNVCGSKPYCWMNTDMMGFTLYINRSWWIFHIETDADKARTHKHVQTIYFCLQKVTFSIVLSCYSSPSWSVAIPAVAIDVIIINTIAITFPSLQSPFRQSPPSMSPSRPFPRSVSLPAIATKSQSVTVNAVRSLIFDAMC